MYIHTHTKYFPKKKRDRVSTGPGKKKKTVESKSSLSKKKKERNLSFTKPHKKFRTKTETS